MDYNSYIKTDEILRLQGLVSNARQCDELTFIVVHQVTELLLKIVLMEIDEIENSNTIDPVQASTSISKINMIFEMLIEQLYLCRTVPREAFLKIRDRVYPASAQESEQFTQFLDKVADGSSSLCNVLVHTLSVARNNRSDEELCAEISRFRKLVGQWQNEHMNIARYYIGSGPGAVSTGVEYLAGKKDLTILPGVNI